MLLFAQYVYLQDLMNSIFSIKNIYFFSAGGIFIYLILRSVFVPPVHDEAATFMHYIQRDEWMPYKAHWDANNHILNSFLSAQIFKIFGQAPFFLRLSSLLFFPLFVVYVYKISRFIQSKSIQIGFLCGMLGVHNLLEYFGYSRGYAMSMALLVAAIFYVLKYFQQFDLKKLAPFYFFSTLALMANLTLFNTILILNGILFLSFITRNRGWLRKVLYILIGLLPIVAAAFLSMDMKKMGLLYYGSNEGFYSLTVWSLVILIYGHWEPMIGIFFTMLAAMAVIFLGAGKFEGGVKNFIFTARWLFAFLFLGNILATILLQKLMGVNYPEDRTAMYFYFFLVMFFCFALDKLPFKKLKYTAFIWLIVPVHFLFNINTTHSSYWYYEHIPNSFYKEVVKRAGAHPEQVSVGGYVLMDMIWAYYNHQAGGKLNDIQTKDYPSFYYDYLLLYNDNNNAYAQDDYTTLLTSPYSGIRLLERKEKIRLKLLVEYTSPDIQGSTDEFVNFYENDSLKKYKNLCVDFSIHFQNSDPFFYGMLTLATFVKGQSHLQESQEFHLLRTEWKKGYDFHHRIYMQNISPATNRIVLYLWNPRKQKVNLSETHIQIYSWNN
jgi:hypothetical protein